MATKERMVTVAEVTIANSDTPVIVLDVGSLLDTIKTDCLGLTESDNFETYPLHRITITFRVLPESELNKLPEFEGF